MTACQQILLVESKLIEEFTSPGGAPSMNAETATALAEVIVSRTNHFISPPVTSFRDVARMAFQVQVVNSIRAGSLAFLARSW